MKMTRDEIVLVAAILATLLLGAGVKHYRETHRPTSAPTAPAAPAAPAEAEQ